LAAGQAWRLFTSQLACESLAEGGVTWFLLYKFRSFERQMGTAKFVAFMICIIAVAAAGRLGLAVLLESRSGGGGAGVASGPYELVFALLVYFFCK
jgi:membrane associated rhomboid family serine protease